MTAPVHACPNVKSWKRKMKWMHLLQMQNAKQGAHTQMRPRNQTTVLAQAHALPTCPNCTASWSRRVGDHDFEHDFEHDFQLYFQ